MDRIEARRVMLLGALTTAIGFLAASRCDSYYSLLAANLVIATGVTSNQAVLRRHAITKGELRWRRSM